jgi:hypothetical protein
VRELISSRVQPAGDYHVRWDGRDGERERVAAGLYFCRLEVGSRTLSQRLVVLD